MTIAEEAKQLVAVAEEKKRLADVAEVEQQRLRNLERTYKGKNRAETNLSYIIGVIKTKAEKGYTNHYISTDNDGAENNGYMHRLKELLTAEGFDVKLSFPSRYIPDSGYDSFGSYESWFALDISWK